MAFEGIFEKNKPTVGIMYNMKEGIVFGEQNNSMFMPFEKYDESELNDLVSVLKKRRMEVKIVSKKVKEFMEVCSAISHQNKV